ncbi:MAG: orotate phosphoribosyltransferase [Endozoicomonadaceae bacterium]|nr:orotate phosphoribosyltransferase [Endozoicomonadaceae bacterium]
MLLPDFKKKLLASCIENNILCFGDFTLKSGRKSPYFFNSGRFNDGLSLKILADAYHQVLSESQISFDVLMGAAYKGIPLVTATSMVWTEKNQTIMPFCFNRKEVKAHGEGGQLVGGSLNNHRVMLLDDIITSGKAITEIIPLIQAEKGQLVGICLTLDRQEKAKNDHCNALEALSKKLGVPVLSVLTLDNILAYLEDQHEFSQIEKIQTYHQQYK